MQQIRQADDDKITALYERLSKDDGYVNKCAVEKDPKFDIAYF